MKAARLVAGGPALSRGEPPPEDTEAVATYLPRYGFDAGERPLDATRLLYGETPEANGVGVVGNLPDAVSRPSKTPGGGMRASPRPGETPRRLRPDPRGFEITDMRL